MRGGDRTAGRDGLQARMKQGDAPLFTISPEAKWTVQAVSGGYSYPPGDDHPMDNEYNLISAAIECFMSVISGVSGGACSNTCREDVGGGGPRLPGTPKRRRVGLSRRPSGEFGGICLVSLPLVRRFLTSREKVGHGSGRK
jgi:hypothetical protein